MNSNELKALYKREDDEAIAASARAVFATPAGRRLLMHLITLSGVYRSVNTEDYSNPGILAGLSGRREIGLSIMALCNRACPDALLTATQERLALQARRTAAIDSANQTQGTRHV